MKRTSAADELWRSFANTAGGEIVEGRAGKVKAIRVGHGAWTIVLDIYVVSTGKTTHSYTRARALGVARLPFKFVLQRENALRRLGKLLGMQDIHAGNPEVDRNFIIKSDNESMIRSLLIDPVVYRPLLEQKAPRFEFGRFRGRRKDKTEDLAELRFLAPVVMSADPQLSSILVLMKATLDQLARTGAISMSAPNHAL